MISEATMGDVVFDSPFEFIYKFNEREVKLLAKLFRYNQGRIPDELGDFARKVELTIYENMSIDEVEKFYS